MQRLTQKHNSGSIAPAHGVPCVEFETSVVGASRRVNCATFFVSAIRREGANITPAREISAPVQHRVSTPATSGDFEASSLVVFETINVGDVMSLLSLNDLNTTINHEPRVHDLRLAQALGFENPLNIRKLIARHAEYLKQFGSLHMEKTSPSAKGGRPTTEYWLNKKQGLYICAKSSTDKAALVTIEMVEVFEAYQNGLLPIAKPVQQKLPIQHRPIDAKAIHDACDEVLTVLGHFKMLAQHSQSSKATLKVHNLLLDAAKSATRNIVKEVIYHA